MDEKKSVREVQSRDSNLVNDTRSPSRVIEMEVMNLIKEYLDSMCLLLDLSYSVKCFSITLFILFMCDW